MILYVIRHGQSQRNLDKAGPFDCQLTDLGVRQAYATGEWLEGKGIESLYCSPTHRTLNTARIIGKALALTPKTWSLLVEWGYLFDEPGMTRRELARKYPDVVLGEEYPEERGWASDITNEDWQELSDRGNRVKEGLLRDHPVGSPPVAVVTHAHFSRFFVGTLLGMCRPMEWDGDIRHNNCGVTCIEFKEKETILWYSNAYFHLGELAEGDTHIA